MKRHTRKLSGPGLDRFFQRFFRRQPGLAPEEADRLAKISSRTFASARIRTVALQALMSAPRKARRMPHTAQAIARESPVEATPTTTESEPVAAAPSPPPEPPPPATRLADPQKPPSAASTRPPVAPATTFDPYIFGLVPVYQRQGPDGLLERLGEIKRVDHLRKMARAQQIVLPADLRSGDVPAETIRSGIVTAVGKRIADRRAAAG